MIDDTLLDAHTIETVDLNQDGQDEIVVGFRGKPYGVNMYSWDGVNWQRRVLDRGDVSAAGCTIADVDGDGNPDIVCIGSATHNLVLYRNLGR